MTADQITHIVYACIVLALICLASGVAEGVARSRSGLPGATADDAFDELPAGGWLDELNEVWHG